MNKEKAQGIRRQVAAFCKAKGIPFSNRLYRRAKREVAKGSV